MEEREIVLSLHEEDGVGWKTIAAVTERCPDLPEWVDAPPEQFHKCGFSERAAVRISHALTKAVIAKRLDKLRTTGKKRGFLTPDDAAYPHLLLEIPEPPWVLYYRGDPELLRGPAIAVVGTRTPTAYGRRTASRIARELSDAGAAVVSGLARGIDAEAHYGALQGRIGTVAVLAAGVERAYPPENRRLFEEIAERGLLLSEMPAGTATVPGLFPLRNRIIAGMSWGTVVVEAADRSGSLITAAQALDCSRDVFAVPGPISSPKSRGAHRLIQEGAKLVASVGDILEEYGHILNSKSGNPQLPKSRVLPAGTLSEDEEKVLGHLSAEPVTFDELLELSRMPFGLLHSVLLSLILKRFVEQTDGSEYLLVQAAE